MAFSKTEQYQFLVTQPPLGPPVCMSACASLQKRTQRTSRLLHLHTQAPPTALSPLVTPPPGTHRPPPPPPACSLDALFAQLPTCSQHLAAPGLTAEPADPGHYCLSDLPHEALAAAFRLLDPRRLAPLGRPYAHLIACCMRCSSAARWPYGGLRLRIAAASSLQHCLACCWALLAVLSDACAASACCVEIVAEGGRQLQPACHQACAVHC
jgi:hypothetical protein